MKTNTLARRAEWCYRMSQLRHKYTRQGSFENGFEKIEGAERSDKDPYLSDHGKGADVIRSFDEIEPLWCGLFDQVMRDLKFQHRSKDYLTRLKAGNKLAVIKALLEDSRPAVACQICEIPRRSFYRIMEKLKVDFEPCFQAYKAHLHQNRWHTF